MITYMHFISNSVVCLLPIKVFIPFLFSSPLPAFLIHILFIYFIYLSFFPSFPKHLHKQWQRPSPLVSIPTATSHTTHHRIWLPLPGRCGLTRAVRVFCMQIQSNGSAGTTDKSMQLTPSLFGNVSRKFQATSLSNRK